MSERLIKLDAHFHLDLYRNYQQIVTNIASEKIFILAVTNTPSVFHFTKKLADKHAFILPAMGLHPELVNERYNELEILLKSISREKFIGEIGLDYSKKYSSKDKELQRNVFEKIVRECYDVGNRILSIHSRNAASDVINIIGDSFPGTVILHWYSGGLKDLAKAIEHKFYFSVNTAMIRSKAGQKIISRIPPSQILTETDGPFVETKNRPAEPHDINTVTDYLGAIWEADAFEATSQISDNVYSAGILTIPKD